MKKKKPVKKRPVKKKSVIKFRKKIVKLNKVTLRQRIADIYFDEKPVFADGFDDAIIGIDEDTHRVIYSIKKAIDIIYKETKLTKKDLSKEEIECGITVNDKRMEMAVEHFEYNVSGSKGEGYPIWCEDCFN